LLLVLAFAIPAVAQEGSGRYYSETGHTLDGEFLPYFNQHGGLEILGYPITDAFIDYWSGLVVQYTQNSRLELYPDPETKTMQVRLKELGVLFVGDRALDLADPVAIGSNSDCEYYPLTGHNVCYMFLEYYEQHGGPALFGYPVSEFTVENDRLVQYFQGFRLDWYPENPQSSKVQVAPLGRVHFERMGYDRDLLRPRAPSNALAYEIVDLHPKSSVQKAVVKTADTQRVFVVVRDQNLLPVSSAAVTLVVNYPTETRTLTMPPTNLDGVSQYSLEFSGLEPGDEVDLEFFISSGTVLTSTRDSFRVWW
jgi:hypothetical protein